MISKFGTNFTKVYCRNLNYPRHIKPSICSALTSKTSALSVLSREQSSSFKHSNLNKRYAFKEESKFEDTFGNLDDYERCLFNLEDPEDIKEYQRSKQAQGKSIFEYVKEIHQLLANHEYVKAIKVLEVDMVNDKKPAVSHIYDMLISYNGKIGNLKEAYRLYSRFKNRQGLPSGGMYTSLFNACANCTDSNYALEKADALREYMENDKRRKANISNYNAMLKAYARHGDMSTCLNIFDEILEKRENVKSGTYTFLIQACISDKNSGLRHALIIWRKMLQNRVKPCIYSFNLMLRCVRDCSFGDVELINVDLVKKIMNENNKFTKKKVVYQIENGVKKRRVITVEADGSEFVSKHTEEKKKLEAIPSHGKSVTAEVSEKQISLPLSESTENQSPIPVLSYQKVEGDGNEFVSEKSEEEKAETNAVIAESMKADVTKEDTSLSVSESVNYQCPNFLALRPKLGSVINFEAMTKPEERFVTVGGVDGFLEVMSEFKVQPDCKTFSLILSLIPSSTEAEEKVLKKVEEFKVKLDTGFFNILIKRRCFREDEKAVKDAVQKLQETGNTPDILTFGILALGCKNYEKGKELIDSARSLGFRLNVEILGALMKNAYRAEDLKYAQLILKVVKEDEVQVDHKFCFYLREVINKAKKKLNSSEKIPSIES